MGCYDFIQIFDSFFTIEIYEKNVFASIRFIGLCNGFSSLSNQPARLCSMHLKFLHLRNVFLLNVSVTPFNSFWFRITNIIYTNGQHRLMECYRLSYYLFVIWYIHVMVYKWYAILYHVCSHDNIHFRHILPGIIVLKRWEKE